ncbi:MAG: rod-binding protein [Nitrospiraceae bacterium]|nr:rod-binding protein [Nitrospiraceae bacterium]
MFIDDAISPQSLNKYMGRKGPEAIKAVAENMETLFTYELVKEMRATTLDDNKDFGQQTYTSMFDMQLAQMMAQKETGLRDMIVKQLDRLSGQTENSKVTHEQSTSNSLNSNGKTASITNTSGGPVTNGDIPPASGYTGSPSGIAGKMDEKIKKMIKAAFGSQTSNAISVAFAESSGNFNALHYNTPYGSTDYGLFQINDRFWADRLMKKGIINSVSDLFDPKKNIEAAAWIYKHGGWNQWTSVQSGRVQLGSPDVLEADNSTGKEADAGNL